MAIDVGYDFSTTGDDNGSGTTVITITNPANAIGTLNQAKLCPNGTGVTGLKVGVFYVVSGATMTSRDYETLGDLGGGTQTVSGLNIDTETGDYAGWVSTSGGLQYHSGDFRYYKVGDYFGQADIKYTYIYGAYDLLYMTGTETAAGQPFIKRFGGVPYAALNRGVF